MKAELTRQWHEDKDMEKKAYMFDRMFTLLANALDYMIDNNLSDDEMANYIGTSTEMLDAIYVSDYETIIELIKEGE